MTRGNNKHDVFLDPEDYEKYLEMLRKYKLELPFDLYHYCLMTNHVHMLVRTDKAEDFSTLMKKLNLAYYYWYKKKYGWVGHFWQGRFKTQAVGKDAYFIQCGKYVELNPVRAKLVSDPGQYQFSSFNFYAEGKEDDLVSEDMFYQSLGKNQMKRREAYRELVVGEEVKRSYSQSIWGVGEQKHNEQRKRKYHENRNLSRS